MIYLRFDFFVNKYRMALYLPSVICFHSCNALFFSGLIDWFPPLKCGLSVHHTGHPLVT